MVAPAVPEYVPDPPVYVFPGFACAWPLLPIGRGGNTAQVAECVTDAMELL